MSDLSHADNEIPGEAEDEAHQCAHKTQNQLFSYRSEARSFRAAPPP